MSWLLWYAKGDQNYPWRVQNQEDSSKVIWAKSVVLNCLSVTDQHPDLSRSHPPPFTVRIFGTPEQDAQMQNELTFIGARI